ncbi:hypothetical protein FACS1894179_02850 [Bacteroidia bacterium]|nr:hypothetical protein FACS1894179_02850 [Bacteroidia bacterium]
MESIIEQLKDRLLTIRSLEEKKKKITTSDMEKVKRSISFLISWNLDIGIGDYFILQQDISLKQCSYSVARLIDYSIKNFNSRIFDYDIYNVSFAFLCDNIDYLRNTFANLAYKGDGKNYPDMDIMVRIGEPCIYIHSMLQILKQDWDTLARNISILEQKVINKKKNELFIPDYEFYKAILEKNKEEAERAIYRLLEPKNHKKRNDDYIVNQLISMPALGYAKLAWLSGVEVEINDPLVPKELLPLQPNEKYNDYYDFLKSNQ